MQVQQILSIRPCVYPSVYFRHNCPWFKQKIQHNPEKVYLNEIKNRVIATEYTEERRLHKIVALSKFYLKSDEMYSM